MSGFSSTSIEHAPATTREAFNKVPIAEKISLHARALGEKYPDMWKTDFTEHSEIRKCNLFVDKVFRDLGIPLPWGKGQMPAIHGMKEQLGNSPEWRTVYHKGDKFDKYKPQAGDLVIWDKTIYIQHKERKEHVVMQKKVIEHSGVIGADGKIMYAGLLSGYRESDFNLIAHSVAYGAPTSIYRSKCTM